MKERLTCQKEFVFAYLKSVDTHPSIEEIYKAVKKKLPRISLGTVYRIVKQMRERRLILEIPAKPARYDARLLPHSHFICDECGGVFDIFNKINLPRKIAYGHARDCQIYFYGVCKKCLMEKSFKKAQ